MDQGCQKAYWEMLRSHAATCPAGRWPRERVRFVRTAELAEAANHLADLLPPDISRIVGVPRSGMLPAAIVATKLHLPLYTICNFEVVPVGGGIRAAWGNLPPRDGRTAFVDDTIHDGGTVKLFRARGIDIDGGVLAVCYAKDPALVDVAAQQLPSPHLLEWNLYNTTWGTVFGSDMDGILCHNPPHQDRPKYLARHVPLKAIITARPESERAETESWLARYGVKYDRLIMWTLSEARRWDLECVARWKADQVVAVGGEFYVESEPPLADAMRRLGIRVLCPDQGYLQ